MFRCIVVFIFVFLFSRRRRHTRCELVTGGQTCALPIFLQRHGVRIVIADLPRLGTACDGLWAAQAGGHADERETSLLLAIAPGLVRLDRLADTMQPEAEEHVALAPLRRLIRLRSERGRVGKEGVRWV